MSMDPLGELQFILKAGGLWTFSIEKNPFKVLLQILQQIVFIVGFTLNVYCISRDGLKESMSGTLIFLPPAIVVPLCHYALFIRQNKIKILIKSFNKIIAKNEDVREIYANDYLFAFKCGKICRYTLFIIWITFFTMPPFMELIFYLAGLNEFPIHIPAIINYTFMEKGRLQNCLSGLFGTLWTACAMCSHFGFVISNITFLMYFCIELKIFKYQMKYQYGLLLTTNQKDHTFKEIIYRQHELIRLLQDLKNVIAFALGIQNTCIGICICYFLYTVTATDNTETKILFTYAFFLFLSDATVCCYAGDLVESEGSAIFQTFFEIPWYEFSPKDRRTFMMLTLQARQSTKIEYKGTAATNLESLLKILQATYSYFMLLKSI